MLNKDVENQTGQHMLSKSHLITGIGSETIAVIFYSHFDVLGGALPTSAQPLHGRRKVITLDSYVYNFAINSSSSCSNLPELTKPEAVKGPAQHSPRPWTSPFAPASSGRTWSHPCSRRCSWGPQTTSVSSGLCAQQ